MRCQKSLAPKGYMAKFSRPFRGRLEAMEQHEKLQLIILSALNCNSNLILTKWPQLRLIENLASAASTQIGN